MFFIKLLELAHVIAAAYESVSYLRSVNVFLKQKSEMSCVVLDPTITDAYNNRREPG